MRMIKLLKTEMKKSKHNGNSYTPHNTSHMDEIGIFVRHVERGVLTANAVVTCYLPKSSVEMEI